jgi:hypothetical protein
MHPRQFALISGLIFLIMGIIAFIPGFSSHDPFQLKPLAGAVRHGMFLGLFPMNVVNKVALLFFGVAGIAAFSWSTKSLPSSIAYARAVAIVMITGAVLGLIPATQTLGGFWPLYGGEVVLHGLFGLLGAYFGFTLPSRARARIEPLIRERGDKDRWDRAA